jgi:uncharacterized protein
VSSTRSEPPVVPRVRALAPDLARGTMLAVIALAHSQILARPFLGSVPEPGPALDTAVQILLTLFVDSRGYPMFAALFGYGMVQILRSREPRLGWDGTRRLLRRRGGWLVVFGFVHVLLLFPGDILASYGVLALLFVGALRWPDPRLFAVAGGLAVLGALVYGTVLALPAPEGDPAVALDPLVSAVYRLAAFPLVMPMNAVMAAAPVLIGIWAGRRRLLDEPERHRRLLGRVAVAGITIAAAGAAPHALVTTGLWHFNPGAGVLIVLGALHTLVGYAGGLGYAALVGLVAARLSRLAPPTGGPVRISADPGFRWVRRRTEPRIGHTRPVRRCGQREAGPSRYVADFRWGALAAAWPVTSALAACGQRSMTCYLAQSVAWLLLLEPYTADLGGALGVAAAAAVGLGVWLVTVVAADLLRRAGRPGPAEALLRHLVYRPSGRG